MNKPHAHAGIDERIKPDQKVNTLPFIINRMSGGILCGHRKAVKFNYPPNILESNKGLVAYNTVNMSNAVTPVSPGRQLKGLKAPLGLWIGELDELLNADKVVAFV